MAYLRLALFFLLLLLAVLFILANSAPVQLSLSLVPYKTPHLPLWLVVMIAVLVAFFAGAISRVLPALTLRRRLLRAEKEIEILKSQLRSAADQRTIVREVAPPPAVETPAGPGQPYA
jgi:uncharacterized integral membrane protein